MTVPVGSATATTLRRRQRDHRSNLGACPGLALDLNRWLVDLDQKLLSVDAISGRALRLKTKLERAGD